MARCNESKGAPPYMPPHVLADCLLTLCITGSRADHNLIVTLLILHVVGVHLCAAGTKNMN
jgi:hypothetical protein